MGNRGGLAIILIIALTMSGTTALQVTTNFMSRKFCAYLNQIVQCYECDSSVDGIEACNDEAASRQEHQIIKITRT